MRVYSSAGRRRRRWSALIIATATAAVVLFSLPLAGIRGGDEESPWAGAGSPQGKPGGALSSREGYVPVPLSPYSDEPPVARLDPVLLDALRQAASDAGAAGITLEVTGGWRSARYQALLLQRAVETHGSLEAAREYVLPPTESKHVTGEAVDVGPGEAAGWLSQHGSEYGLCQIYANEPWHFELATAPGGVCPELISNAAAG